MNDIEWEKLRTVDSKSGLIPLKRIPPIGILSKASEWQSRTVESSFKNCVTKVHGA